MYRSKKFKILQEIKREVWIKIRNTDDNKIEWKMKEGTRLKYDFFKKKKRLKYDHIEGYWNMSKIP